MKNIIVVLLCLSSFSMYGQTQTAFDGHQWQAPYHLTIPKDWTIERFPIPISFAPAIPYKGVEDIRFTPGWAKPATEEYWTYAFLWYLEGPLTMNTQLIAKNLKHYYTGLLKVNTDPSKAPAIKQVPVTTSFKKITTAKNDLETYSGIITMTDYMSGKPITLNCIIHLKYCKEENKTILFHELSPQPFTHKNWEQLNQLWADFVCKKS